MPPETVLSERTSNRRQLGWTLVVVAVLTVLVVACYLVQRRQPAALMEEGFMLDLPLRVLHGAVPESSFQFLYGPMGVWIPAAVYWVFGASLDAERAIGAAYLLALALAVYGIGARHSRLWSAATAVVVVLSGQYAGNIGLMSALPVVGAMGFAALGICFGLNSRAGRGLDIAAGLALALAADLRPEYLIFAILAVTLLIGTRLRSIWLAFAALIGLIPYLALVLLAGFGPVWRALVVASLRLPAERHLPLSTPGKWLIVELVALLIGLLVVSFLVLRRRERRSAVASLLLGLYLLLAGADLLQRSDIQHTLTLGAVIAPVCMLLAQELVVGTERCRRWGLAAGAGLTLLALIPAAHYAKGITVAWVRDYLHDRTVSFAVTNHGRTWLYATAAQASAARQIVAAADAVGRHDHGGTLMTGTADLSQTTYTDNSFYFLLPQFRETSHFYDFHPGVALDDQLQLARDISHASVLILEKFTFHEHNLSDRHGPQIANHVVAARFTPVLHRGHDTLYVRRDATA